MSDTNLNDTATPANPVVAKLKSLGLDESAAAKVVEELGAETEADLVGLTESDLVGVGVKKLKARQIIGALAPVAPAPDSAATPSTVAVSFDTILPAVPADSSWLDALRTGGVLKIDQSTVIAGIKAALAHRVGLFNIPDMLVTAMEKFADTNEEQVPPEFFTMRKQMTRRNYAELFAAIDGLDGSYVTEGRKRELFRRVDQYFWPAILSFNEQLRTWYETWTQTAANPAAMTNALLSRLGGGVAMPMPPMMMQPPDTGVLRDSAAGVNDSLNRVFAGTGVQIAAALAYDASKIKETLSNPRLPALIGVANREQMLKQLGVAVPPTYPRLEQNLTQFVLAVMQAADQTGAEEVQYYGTLYVLGSQITWDLVGGNGANSRRTTMGVTGIGGNRRDNL